MRRILPTFIDTKYDSIIAHERRLAKAIASKVVNLPDVTVWSFMIPLVFIINFFKYKRASETFALNFLFTKKLALDAALDIIMNEQNRQDALAGIEDRTSQILDSDKQGIYSNEIRKKQMNEINLLLGHYLKLLEAGGKSYESLVRNAYQNREEYEVFLQELIQAEKAVNQAAIKTVGETGTATELILTMETITEERRRKEAEDIFSLGN